MGFNDERARGNLRADFVPHQRTVHEAHGVLRLAIDGELRIKVRGIIAPGTQDATTSGRPHLCPPQRWGTMQWPGRQRSPSDQASLQHITTAQARYRSSSWIRCLHE